MDWVGREVAAVAVAEVVAVCCWVEKGRCATIQNTEYRSQRLTRTVAEDSAAGRRRLRIAQTQNQKQNKIKYNLYSQCKRGGKDLVGSISGVISSDFMGSTLFGSFFWLGAGRDS